MIRDEEEEQSEVGKAFQGEVGRGVASLEAGGMASCREEEGRGVQPCRGEGTSFQVEVVAFCNVDAKEVKELALKT